MICPRCGTVDGVRAKRCASCGLFVPLPGRPPLSSPPRAPFAVAGVVAASIGYLGVTACEIYGWIGHEPVPYGETIASLPSIAAPAFFLWWLRALQRDAHELSDDSRALASAYLAFLVPIASLVLPLRLLRGVRASLDPDHLPPVAAPGARVRGRRSRVPVEQWFVAWTAAIVLPLASMHGFRLSSPLAMALGAGLGVVAGLQAIAMVWAFDDAVRELDARARAARGEVPQREHVTPLSLVGQGAAVAVTCVILQVRFPAWGMYAIGCAAGVGLLVWLAPRLLPAPWRAPASAVVSLVLVLVTGPASMAADRSARDAGEALRQTAEAIEAASSAETSLEHVAALLAQAEGLASRAPLPARAMWLCRARRGAEEQRRVRVWNETTAAVRDVLVLPHPLATAELRARRDAVDRARGAIADRATWIRGSAAAHATCLRQQGLEERLVQRAHDAQLGLVPASLRQLQRDQRVFDAAADGLAALAAGAYVVVGGVPSFVDPAVQREWDDANRALSAANLDQPRDL